MLLEPQFRTPELDALWSAEARVARLCAFEAALAEAEADVGIIPAQSARIIARVCREAPPDAEAIHAAAATAGNPAIPFVAALMRATAALDPTAADHVHLGATSQDAIDTATMLALKAAASLVADALTQAADRSARLAETHAETPMVGRTLLQQATPVSFGHVAALWMTGLDRAAMSLRRVAAEAPVQFGGAVGTLATLGGQGPAVRSGLAQRLGLADPGLCWHRLRNPILTAATAFATACGAAGALGRDVQLLMQTEVGEVAEGAGPGRGGSSAMPHKRNPVDSLVCTAAAQAAAGPLAVLAQSLVGEHQRPVGAWHAEWMVLPLLTTLAHAAARAADRVVEGLEVDAGAMAVNLDRQQGLIAAEALTAALVPALGARAARALVETLCRRSRDDGVHMRTVAAAEPRVMASVSADALEGVFTHRAAITAAAAEARRLVRHRTR